VGQLQLAARVARPGRWTAMIDREDLVDDKNPDDAADSAAQRRLIAAYLSSARYEVAMLSPTGLRLLEMTIASLTKGVAVNAVDRTPDILS
jgi:hypothetical protein